MCRKSTFHQHTKAKCSAAYAQKVLYGHCRSSMVIDFGSNMQEYCQHWHRPMLSCPQAFSTWTIFLQLWQLILTVDLDASHYLYTSCHQSLMSVALQIERLDYGWGSAGIVAISDKLQTEGYACSKVTFCCKNAKNQGTFGPLFRKNFLTC